MWILDIWYELTFFNVIIAVIYCIVEQLLYSEYFHGFLCSEEQNEAVSNIKLGQYSEAAPLLETIFYVRSVEIYSKSFRIYMKFSTWRHFGSNFPSICGVKCTIHNVTHFTSYWLMMTQRFSCTVYTIQCTLFTQFQTK